MPEPRKPVLGELDAGLVDFPRKRRQGLAVGVLQDRRRRPNAVEEGQEDVVDLPQRPWSWSALAVSRWRLPGRRRPRPLSSLAPGRPNRARLLCSPRRKSETGSRYRLEPCFQRWVLLLVSAVTALGLLERFLTRPQALRIPSFVDRAIVAATPSACKYGVTACDRGKFPLLRVDSVCSVSPAASAGSFALCHCAIGVVFALGDCSLLCSQPGKLPLAFGPR